MHRPVRRASPVSSFGLSSAQRIGSATARKSQPERLVYNFAPICHYPEACFAPPAATPIPKGGRSVPIANSIRSPRVAINSHARATPPRHPDGSEARSRAASGGRVRGPTGSLPPGDQRHRPQLPRPREKRVGGGAGGGGVARESRSLRNQPPPASPSPRGRRDPHPLRDRTEAVKHSPRDPERKGGDAGVAAAATAREAPISADPRETDRTVSRPLSALRFLALRSVSDSGSCIR